MTAFAVYTPDRLLQRSYPPASTQAQSREDAADQLLRVEPLCDGRTGWRLIGETDMSNRDRLERVLAAAVGGQCGADGLIHFELSTLAFIDLSGTRALVRAATALHESGGGRVALHHPPYALRRVAGLLLGSAELDADDCLVLPADS
ncbi:MAG: STAS domain-containing protein [Streptosporangiales bacterium]